MSKILEALELLRDEQPKVYREALLEFAAMQLCAARGGWPVSRCHECGAFADGTDACSRCGVKRVRVAEGVR